MCALPLAVLFSAKVATAQVGGYALFTGADLDTTSTTTTRIYGPTFGFYADFPTPVVKIGGDLRGYLLNGSSKQHYNGVIGPRVEVDLPIVKLKPYGEVLFGVGSYKELSTTDATQHIDYEYIVGVDRKLIAIFDWRILEFSYCNYYNGTVPTKALSTGLVLRIP